MRKNYSNRCTLVLASVLVMVLLAACSQAPKPSPTPASPVPAPAATSAAPTTPAPKPPSPSPTTQAAPIKIVFSTFYPPQSYPSYTEPVAWFNKEIEKRSNGRLVISYFGSAQLFDMNGEMDALSRGDIDMSLPLATFFSGSDPAVAIESIPYLLGPPYEWQWRAYQEVLLDKLYRPTYARHGIYCLASAPYGATNQIFTKKQLKSLAELKGMTIRAAGAAMSVIVQQLGANPVSLTSSEIYTAFQRGTVDGGYFPLITVDSRKLWEVCKYGYMIDLISTVSPLAINMKKWNSLPKDLQDIIQATATEAAHMSVGMLDKELARIEGVVKEKGMVLYYPTPAEAAEVRAKVEQPLTDWYLKQYPDGKPVIDALKAWIQKNPRPQK